jgi:hypothetical protein
MHIQDDIMCDPLKHITLSKRMYYLKKLFMKIFYVHVQHCCICRPSDSTVSEAAGIEPRTVATLSNKYKFTR